jgi:fumarate reductase subunit C
MMNRRPYVRKISKLWWLGWPHHTIYMARELTSVAIGAYAIVLIVGLFSLARGQADYAAFLEALRGPPAIFFHFIALIMALLHTVTWFGLTPKAMPPTSGRPVPGTVIIAAHYAVWVVLTAGLVLAAAKGGA